MTAKTSGTKHKNLLKNALRAIEKMEARLAEYEQARNEIACSGREAYKRYVEEVFPILETYHAKMVFAGAGLATVIGPEDETWDDVLIVEYPSHDSFMQMSISQAYKNISYHREAALLDSRLISTDTNFSKYNDSI